MSLHHKPIVKLIQSVRFQKWLSLFPIYNSEAFLCSHIPQNLISFYFFFSGHLISWKRLADKIISLLLQSQKTCPPAMLSLNSLFCHWMYFWHKKIRENILKTKFKIRFYCFIDIFIQQMLYRTACCLQGFRFSKRPFYYPDDTPSNLTKMIFLHIKHPKIAIL